MLDNAEKIHRLSMQIMEKTGMLFHHPDAVRILKEHGIRMEGHVAYFTEDQLMYWIHKAPANIDLFAEDPRYHVALGGRRSYSAPPSGSPQISDQTGEKRPALVEDYVKLVKLFEANPKYKINGGIVVFPDDVPVDNACLMMYYAAYTHSDKALMTGTGNYGELETLMQMGIAAAGSREEFEARPRMLTIANANTPLQLDHKMTETILTFGKYRQPCVIASAAMAGTTSPVTLAGTIAMVNVEVLTSIALAQMANPGCPVIYGSQTTTADLRNGAIAIGAPEGALCYKYCAKMAKYYGLPCRGGGSLSDAKVVCAQAGYESMLTYIACRQNEMNLIVQSAGILNGYTTVSYEKVVMDFEVMDYVDRYLADVDVNDETVPVDLIDELGREESYLLDEHTLEWCRKEPLTPKLAVRGTSSHPAAQFDENIQKEMERLWDSYKKPERDPAVLEQMKELLARRGVDRSLAERVENL
ncbi:MAG TPA: trimethylamine methyltransferase [Lachnospiraceae bacterium]|nr:trimethylamine methyltransferase [Lachnospiraceae bacterium]